MTSPVQVQPRPPGADLHIIPVMRVTCQISLDSLSLIIVCPDSPAQGGVCQGSVTAMTRLGHQTTLYFRATGCISYANIVPGAEYRMVIQVAQERPLLVNFCVCV